MPLKIGYVSEEAVSNSGRAPKKGFLPHGDIINIVKKAFTAHGYTVTSETYRLTPTEDIVQGIHHLDSGHIFTWVYSHVNSFGFHCVLGYDDNKRISIDRTPSICKMKTGLTAVDIRNAVDDQIAIRTSVDAWTMKNDLEELDTTNVFTTDIANIVGRLFILENVLTLTQLGILKKEFDIFQPATAHILYSTVLKSLDESHPYTYIMDRYTTYNVFMKYFGKQNAGMIRPTPTVDVPERTVITIDVEKFKHDPSVIFL